MCVCIVYVYIYVCVYRRTQDPWVRGADGLLLTAEIARATSCIISPSPNSPQGDANEGQILPAHTVGFH